MAWAAQGMLDLAARMEAGRAHGFRVSARTAGLVIDALQRYARENCCAEVDGFTVEVWDAGESHVIKRIAQVSHLAIARAVFRLAVEIRPGQAVTKSFLLYHQVAAPRW